MKNPNITEIDEALVKDITTTAIKAYEAVANVAKGYGAPRIDIVDTLAPYNKPMVGQLAEVMAFVAKRKAEILEAEALLERMVDLTERGGVAHYTAAIIRDYAK